MRHWRFYAYILGLARYIYKILDCNKFLNLILSEINKVINPYKQQEDQHRHFLHN